MVEGLKESDSTRVPGGVALGDESELPLLRTEELMLNMGPQHPATHGVLKILLDLEGERIVRATPVLG